MFTGRLNTLAVHLSFLIKQEDIMNSTDQNIENAIPSLNIRIADIVANISNEGDWRYRISDENNDDVYKVYHTPGEDEGVNSLLIKDLSQNIVFRVVYQIGYGLLQILNGADEFLGECSSTVGFKCLSFKLKYIFWNGESRTKRFKMTGIVANDDNRKFSLKVCTVDRRHIAQVKMGSLRNCCRIGFSLTDCSPQERALVLATWIGFMDYELYETSIQNSTLRPPRLISPAQENNNQAVIKSQENIRQTSLRIKGRLENALRQMVVCG